MKYTIKPVEVWAGDILNRPGSLARVLEALTLAGADLEFIVARRVTANTSRVFVAPLRTARQRAAARDVELRVAEGIHALRIEGPDKPGLAAALARTCADAGLNMRGVSAAMIGRKCVFYVAFQSPAEATAAQRAFRKHVSQRR